jgi:uncharacterized protein
LNVYPYLGDMKIIRILESFIEKRFFSGKAIVLIGPRQVGKTTLLRDILKSKGDFLFLDGDDSTVRSVLEDINTQALKQLIGQHTIVFIDEAQRINSIGITTKIIVDQLPNVQVVLSGSSAFELNHHISESLTGRKWPFTLYPISWTEFVNARGVMTGLQDLENRLLFGMYPDVINRVGEEKIVLKELTNSYLYKDVLSLSGIKKPEALDKLLQALALQIGSEVSYNELSSLVGINKQTISEYIDLLEKAFVIFKLSSFSRNVRNELKNSRKIYFYDLGIRNTLINNFNPINIRQDKGALWENFLLVERRKKNEYTQSLVRSYFWRTTQQQEIDYIEEIDGQLSAFEFKWNPKTTVRISKTFSQNYEVNFQVIHKDNFMDFI